MESAYSYEWYSEILIVKNTDSCKELINKLRWQYVLLGTLMLDGPARILNMQLKIRNKTYSNRGSTIDLDFHDLLDALHDVLLTSNEFSLTTDYEYWFNEQHAYLNIGPIPTRNCAENLLKNNPNLSKDFFYALHKHNKPAESDELYAYGERNGHNYYGKVVSTSTDDFSDAALMYP